MNLNELIAAHKGAQSYADLARATGGLITAQRLQQMATTPPKEFPRADNVRALAKALRVREAVVVLAAAESLGLSVDHAVPRIAQLLPATAGSLTDAQVAALAQLIEAFAPPAEPRNEGLEHDDRVALLRLVDREHGTEDLVDLWFDSALAVEALVESAGDLDDALEWLAGADGDEEDRQLAADELRVAWVQELEGREERAVVVTPRRAEATPAAARNIGRLSRGQQRRADADQAGEPPADDHDDMESR